MAAKSLLKPKKKVGKKLVAQLALDFLCANLLYFLMVFLHWNFRMDMELATRLCLRIPYVTLFYIGFNFVFRTYSTLWKYAGLYDMVRFGLSGICATGCVFTCDYVGMKICRELMALGYLTKDQLYFNVLPFSVYMDVAIFFVAFGLFARMTYRLFYMFSTESRRYQNGGRGGVLCGFGQRMPFSLAGQIGQTLNGGVDQLQGDDQRRGQQQHRQLQTPQLQRPAKP